MSEATTRSTTARIRFPNEFLAELDAWAAAHGLPRSVAVRVLILRGLSLNLKWTPSAGLLLWDY